MKTQYHPLVAAAKALTRSTDKAEAKARELLEKISIDDVLNDPTDTLRSMRLALFRDITPEIRSAFKSSRLNAWLTAMRTPGRNGKVRISKRDKAFVKANRHKINDAEKALIAARAGAASSKLQAESVALVTRIPAWAEAGRTASRDSKSLRMSLEFDWNLRNSNGNPKGRITSQWQTQFIRLAREAVAVADDAGFEAGYTGLGWFE